jgi:aminoglycoside 2'-N-acetyltransferase I
MRRGQRGSSESSCSERRAAAFASARLSARPRREPRGPKERQRPPVAGLVAGGILNCPRLLAYGRNGRNTSANNRRMSQVQPQLLLTAEMDGGTRRAARGLLDDVFGAEMTDQDWDHCLGGVHALVWEGKELVGHGSVIRRQLLHAALALRTGYVEGLAVRPDRRRQGYGAAMMTSLEGVIRGGYDIGALSTTEEAASFYATRGWTLWRGTLSAFTPRGIERTPEDEDGIYILPVSVTLDIWGELTCDWREGDLW